MLIKDNNWLSTDEIKIKSINLDLVSEVIPEKWSQVLVKASN